MIDRVVSDRDHLVGKVGFPNEWCRYGFDVYNFFFRVMCKPLHSIKGMCMLAETYTINLVG